MRVWDIGGNSTKNLDYSHRNGEGSQNGGEQNQEAQSDLVRTVTLNSLFSVFHRFCDNWSQEIIGFSLLSSTRSSSRIVHCRLFHCCL